MICKEALLCKLINQDKTEIMLNFSQNVPVPTVESSTDSETSFEVIPVSNLVMNRKCATSLAKILAELLDDSSSQTSTNQ